MANTNFFIDKLFIQYLLFTYQESYVHALEVKNRVEEDLLSKTISDMENTIGAYESFVDAVQFNIIQTATSITDRIQDAISKVMTNTNRDVICTMILPMGHT